MDENMDEHREQAEAIAGRITEGVKMVLDATEEAMTLDSPLRMQPDFALEGAARAGQLFFQKIVETDIAQGKNMPQYAREQFVFIDVALKHFISCLENERNKGALMQALINGEVAGLDVSQFFRDEE
jgi:hypothetical protein